MSYANWQSSTTYTTNDIVEYNGYLWISLITPNLNNIPGAGSSAWGSQSPSSGGVLSVTAGTGITVVGTTNVVVSASPTAIPIPYAFGSATPQTYGAENPTVAGFVGTTASADTIALAQLVFAEPYNTFIITLNCAYLPLRFRSTTSVATTTQVIIFPGQNNGDTINYTECSTPLTFPSFNTSSNSIQYTLGGNKQTTMIYRVATPTQTVSLFPIAINTTNTGGYIQLLQGTAPTPSILFSAIAYNG